MQVCENMQKVRDRLDELGIKWTDKSDAYITRTHLWIKGQRWSIVNGLGTYGGISIRRMPDGSYQHHNKGLLEVQIGMQEEPIGHLAAYDVLTMIYRELF